jgi:hypothetical protein
MLNKRECEDFQDAQDLEDDDEQEDENDSCKCAARTVATPADFRRSRPF